MNKFRTEKKRNSINESTQMAGLNSETLQETGRNHPGSLEIYDQ